MKRDHLEHMSEEVRDIFNLSSQLDEVELDNLLLVLSADTNDLVNFWDSMVSENLQYFSAKTQSSATVRPYVREINPDFNTHPNLGNCMVAYVKNKPQMSGQVRLRVIVDELDDDGQQIIIDSKYQTKEVIMNGTKNTKVELHHVAFYVAMIKNHNSFKNGFEGADAELEKVYQMFLTIQRRQMKKQDSLMIIHRCGNHWCGNWRHLSVCTKKINDEQVHCHYFIQSRRTAEEALAFIDQYCNHTQQHLCIGCVYPESTFHRNKVIQNAEQHVIYSSQ